MPSGPLSTVIYSTVTKIHMWMAEISVDLIQMVYYHADSYAISSSAFLFLFLSCLSNGYCRIVGKLCFFSGSYLLVRTFFIENGPLMVVLVIMGDLVARWTSMVCSVNDARLVSMIKDTNGATVWSDVQRNKYDARF